jgi:hypothetical protein
MLPKEVGKYVKQFGGRVEKADMTQSVEADIMSGEEAETGSIPIWKVNITPEMRKISQTGQMRFMPEKLDSDYMKAVESGDVEAQQRMVDEAAKQAGYSVKAYHGTPEGGFVTFETQRKNLKKGVGNTADPNTFLGAHFAEEESVARRFMDELYGGNESPKNPQLYGVYLKIQNPLGGDSFVPGDIVATKEVAIQQRSKYKEVKEKIQKLNDELRNKELDANIQGDVNLISSGKISEWVESKNNESKAKFPKEHSEIEKLKQQADEISSKLGRPKQIQIPNGKTLFLEGDRGLVSEGEFGIEALSNVGTGRNPEAEASKSEDKRWRTAIGRSMRENFDKLGYDAVIYDNAVEGGVSIIVPTPEQIKSADPITRDDSGNVIPLSKRFDLVSRDIRYMPESEAKEANLKLLQTKETLKDWAFGQANWKDWYSEHQETLDDFFGDQAELFQEILAVTSQAASVKANVGLALKAFGQLMRNEEFDGKLRGEEKSGYLPAVIKNLNAIKNKTQVGGRKISNYKSANEGDSSKVVVDRHIARMLFGFDTPTAKQYAKAESVLSDVAKELGWEPAQVQAALWAQSIVMSGKEPVSYGAYLKSLEAKKLTKKELISGLKGNQITRRIGQLSGSGYGSNELSKARGRYSPASENAPKGKKGLGASTPKPKRSTAKGDASAIANAAKLK